jgi:TfoX/Sxy family transcriptional regulator of competence genes
MTADERWAALCEEAAGGPVTVGTMFGSKGLRTGRKFFAIWWHSRLVLKLPVARMDHLVEARQGEPFEPMAGRRMNGWVVVEPTTDWPELTREAQVYVESLQA